MPGKPPRRVRAGREHGGAGLGLARRAGRGRRARRRRGSGRGRGRRERRRSRGPSRSRRSSGRRRRGPARRRCASSVARTVNPSRTPTATSTSREARRLHSGPSTAGGASSASSGRSTASGSISSSARAGPPSTSVSASADSHSRTPRRRPARVRRPARAPPRPAALGRAPRRRRRRNGRPRRAGPGGRAARPAPRARRRARSSSGCTASGWTTCSPGGRGMPAGVAAQREQHAGGPRHRAAVGERDGQRAQLVAQPRHGVDSRFERRVHRPPPAGRSPHAEEPVGQLGRTHPVHVQLGEQAAARRRLLTEGSRSNRGEQAREDAGEQGGQLGRGEVQDRRVARGHLAACRPGQPGGAAQHVEQQLPQAGVELGAGEAGRGDQREPSVGGDGGHEVEVGVGGGPQHGVSGVARADAAAVGVERDVRNQPGGEAEALPGGGGGVQDVVGERVRIAVGTAAGSAQQNVRRWRSRCSAAVSADPSTGSRGRASQRLASPIVHRPRRSRRRGPVPWEEEGHLHVARCREGGLESSRPTAISTRSGRASSRSGAAPRRRRAAPGSSLGRSGRRTSVA